MKPIERPGTANVGEFSPLVTPVNTGESVTTAQDQAMNHSKTPSDPGPSGSMTKEHIPTSTPVRR